MHQDLGCFGALERWWSPLSPSAANHLCSGMRLYPLGKCKDRILRTSVRCEHHFLQVHKTHVVWTGNSRKLPAPLRCDEKHPLSRGKSLVPAVHLMVLRWICQDIPEPSRAFWNLNHILPLYGGTAELNRTTGALPLGTTEPTATSYCSAPSMEFMLVGFRWSFKCSLYSPNTPQVKVIRLSSFPTEVHHVHRKYFIQLNQNSTTDSYVTKDIRI